MTSYNPNENIYIIFVTLPGPILSYCQLDSDEAWVLLEANELVRYLSLQIMTIIPKLQKADVIGEFI